VEAGLEIRGMKKTERQRRAQELIDLVGLAGFEDYFPHQISGGMRQRASLIRTLAYDLQVILMDEPFGALDAQTRMILQAELIRIWAAQRKTILVKEFSPQRHRVRSIFLSKILYSARWLPP
jgi:NitT/TauT family transport system ATP-binding protein